MQQIVKAERSNSSHKQTPRRRRTHTHAGKCRKKKAKQKNARLLRDVLLLLFDRKMGRLVTLKVMCQIHGATGKIGAGKEGGNTTGCDFHSVSAKLPLSKALLTA